MITYLQCFKHKFMSELDVDVWTSSRSGRFTFKGTDFYTQQNKFSGEVKTLLQQNAHTS
jgi:hypothetical protein